MLERQVRHKEHSFGIIGVRSTNGNFELLLVKHGKGHWSFPKGHPEPHETPRQTAVRELKEETGAVVKKFFKAPALEEHYFFTSKGALIEKKVTYFLAEIEGEITMQTHEITDFRWVCFEEAQQLATFSECKKLCREVACYFSS